MTQGRSHRFARNVGWNIAGMVVTAAANILFIPYLVRGMGQANYGLYILMHTVASYLLLLSFGAGPTTVKFVAELHGAKDGRALHDVLRYSIWVHALGVLSGAAVLFFGAGFCAQRLFHVPESSLPLAVIALRCAALGAVFASLVQYSSCVLQGLQRFDWANALSSLQSVCMPLGAVATVALGLGLAGAASWYVVLCALVAVCGLTASWTLLRPARHFNAGRGLEPRRFASYGASIWLTLVAWVVAFQCDKIFLARGTSLSDLTLYSVPSGLLQRVQVMGPLVSNVLIPMMSELHGHEAGATLIRMYLKASRFLLWVALPALILLFLLMPQFLTLWLGGEFGSRGVWPSRLLVLSSLFFILDAVPNAVVYSQGKPWTLTGKIWVQAALSVTLWKLFIPHLGILGVALGSFLAQAVPTTVYLIWLHGRLLRLPEGRYVRETLFSPCASGLLLVLLVFPIHPYVQDWPRLILTVAAGLLLYYGSTWFLLDRDDKQFLRQLLKREPAPLAGV
jgi:O-antigen/teichoic acid export membrane protein